MAVKLEDKAPRSTGGSAREEKRKSSMPKAHTFNRILYEEGLGVGGRRGREIPFPPEVLERFTPRIPCQKPKIPAIPLKVLSLREGEVIECLFYGGLSERETSRLLGISRSSVRSYKNSALQKLRKAMGKDQKGEEKKRR